MNTYETQAAEALREKCERDGRQRKVLRLCMWIDAALHEWGKDPFSWDAYEVVESMGDPAWACAAERAGGSVPSLAAREAVLEVYLVRALKAQGPRGEGLDAETRLWVDGLAQLERAGGVR